MQVLGRKIFPREFGGGGGAAAAVSGDAGVAPAAEEVEVKTIFDLKLVGFEAKAKI